VSPSDAAQTARVEAAAYNLTGFALAVGLPILGIILGFVMRRKENGERFRFLPFVICAVLGVAALIQYVNRDRPALSAADYKAAAASEADIYVNSKPLPAGAVMAPTTAARAREAAEALRAQGQELLAKSGHPGAVVTVIVSDVSANGKIVTRATSSTADGVFSERVEGILNGKLVTIICDPRDPPTFKFEGSPCHRKMEQTFGRFSGIGTPDTLEHQS
jgi:hypothetical protein